MGNFSEVKYPISQLDRGVIFLKNFVKDPNIEIGDYTYFHDSQTPEEFEKRNVVMLYGCKLKIGKFCQIAEGTQFIMSGANHAMNGFSTYPFFIFKDQYDCYVPDLPFKGDTIVGNDVWFGRQSVIMPGVHIGNGAIIGAHAVVTKNVEPYTIVAGNPAQVVRPRFSPEIISLLQKIEWWNWDEAIIRKNINVIVGNDINELERIYSKR